MTFREGTNQDVDAPFNQIMVAKEKKGMLVAFSTTTINITSKGPINCVETFKKALNYKQANSS